MNIATILERQAASAGDRAAIAERGRMVTFAELNRAAAAEAGKLAARGLRPGMRALVFSPMSIALYTTILGLFRLGVAAVFVDPSAGRRHLERSIARVRPEAFVAVPRAHLLRLTSRAIRAIPIKAVIGAWLKDPRGGQGTTPSIQTCTADTPAIITFTSGSTGEPKAAVRSHGFLLAQHRALVESLALEAGDVDLTTLPVFLLANLASGVTSVIPDADLRAPGAIDPKPLVKQIHAIRPTRVTASPALLERLATYSRAHSQALDSFRRIYTGGAPVFPRTLDAIGAVATGAEVVAVYGSTEAEPIAEIERRAIDPADRAAMRQGAGLLAGTPVPSIRLRVLADRWGTALGPWDEAELARASVAPMAAGEIVVSGAHVLSGYLDGHGDEETKIRVGADVWHRTGDAGYVDDRGRLWLLGRCAAKVSDGKGVLYPFAVECAASDVTGVRRSAFTAHKGRRVLVIEPATGAEAVRETLASRLSWARIDDIVLVRRIPVDRRHNAKVDYPALRRLLR
jgi:acyl-CoA synthetase (AMP-forming)/AMP-acid ligase II